MRKNTPEKSKTIQAFLNTYLKIKRFIVLSFEVIRKESLRRSEVLRSNFKIGEICSTCDL